MTLSPNVTVETLDPGQGVSHSIFPSGSRRLLSWVTTFLAAKASNYFHVGKFLRIKSQAK